MKGQQLALGVSLADRYSFDTYFPGPNADVVHALRAYAEAPAAQGLFLFGAPASGKTHLLQALARAAGRQGRRCAYLPAAEMKNDAVALLEGAHAVEVLCLDDVDALLTGTAAAEALIRLVDARRLAGRHLAVSAAAAPERLRAARADVLSRLAACVQLGLRPLSDEDRRALLRTHARERGLAIGEDALRWMLTQLPRDAGSLLAALDELDRASLAAQRRLTLPFVQKTLTP